MLCACPCVSKHTDMKTNFGTSGPCLAATPGQAANGRARPVQQRGQHPRDLVWGWPPLQWRKSELPRLSRAEKPGGYTGTARCESAPSIPHHPPLPPRRVRHTRTGRQGTRSTWRHSRATPLPLAVVRPQTSPELRPLARPGQQAYVSRPVANSDSRQVQKIKV